MTYLICFAMKNAISWGIHLDFKDTSSPIYVHGKFQNEQSTVKFLNFRMEETLL